MSHAAILSTLAGEFARHRIRHALIGGMAVVLLGGSRATRDLDFLVHADDLPAVDGIMARLGYRRTVRTDNFSHYEGRHGFQGAVDVQHAARPVSQAMLRRARVRKAPGLRRAVQVLQPEDLIGLKIQALANDPTRAARDRADIDELAVSRRGRIEWRRVLAYFADFNLRHEGKRLRRRVTGR